ncbi:MAG: AAA family ATPase [Deltaproteobacteria bacterium]|nr:AAA family ATPase [Deltaproteobacteria bacterium]
MTLKELPLTGPSFKEIIDQNLLYADKTRFIHQTLQPGWRKCYFLARPQGFGKTLLVSAYEELFKGNRELFKGLWIGQSDYDFPQVPVLRLSLDFDLDLDPNLKPDLDPDLNPEQDLDEALVNGAYQALNQGLMTYFKSIPDEDFSTNMSLPEYFLGDIIRSLYRKNQNTQIALLVDDYDAPILKMMGTNLRMAKKYAHDLTQFFNVLSGYEDYIRFMLVTGVTRYLLADSDIDLFYLNDVSFKSQYAGICGFTEEELEELFADRFDETLSSLKDSGALDPLASVDDLKAEIRRWYGGYAFANPDRDKAGLKILNPYSTLQFFHQKVFKNYWIQSVTPGHIGPLVKTQPHAYLAPDQVTTDTRSLIYDQPDSLLVGPILFYSGHLTIDREQHCGESYFQFKPPNHEVASSYYSDCLAEFLPLKFREDLKTKGLSLRQAFLSRDATATQDILGPFCQTLAVYLRRLDHKTTLALLQWLLAGLGFAVETELLGLKGRLDLVLKLGPTVYGVIKLSYRPSYFELTPAEKDAALAAVVLKRAPKEDLDHALAREAKNKIPFEEITRIRLASPKNNLSKTELNHLLATAVRLALTEEEFQRILLKTARHKLDLTDILQKTASGLDRFQAEIQSDLSEGAKLALAALKETYYRGPLEPYAPEIIKLGLAVHGYGDHIKALYAPNDPDPRS